MTYYGSYNHPRLLQEGEGLFWAYGSVCLQLFTTHATRNETSPDGSFSVLSSKSVSQCRLLDLCYVYSIMVSRELPSETEHQRYDKSYYNGSTMMGPATQ